MFAAHMPTATSRMDLSSWSTSTNLHSNDSPTIREMKRRREGGTLRQRKKTTAPFVREDEVFFIEEEEEEEDNDECEEGEGNDDKPAAATTTTKGLLRSDITAYALVSFLYALGQSLYDMFQSQQVKKTTPSVYAGAVSFSAYPLAKAVSSPYVGFLSDKFGRRETLTATLILTGVCLRLCGCAIGFWSVLGSRLLTGCVANGGLLTARATDVAADHAQRTTLFSVFTTAWACARVVAAAVVKLANADIRSACKVASYCEYTAALVAAFAFRTRGRRIRGASRDTQDKRDEASVAPLKWHSMRDLAKEMFSERLAFWLFVIASLLTPRVDAHAFVSKKFGAGPDDVGSLKAVEAVAVVVATFYVQPKWWSKQFRGENAAVAASLLVSVGWIGIALAPSMAALYPLVALRAVFSALYDPAARSIVFARKGNKSNKNPRGSMVGFHQCLKGATQVSSAWLGAFLTSLSVEIPLGASAIASVANAAAIAIYSPSDHADGIPPRNKIFAERRSSATVAAESVTPFASEQLAQQALRDIPDAPPTPRWVGGEMSIPKEDSSYLPGQYHHHKRLSLICRCETLRDEEDSASFLASVLSLTNSPAREDGQAFDKRAVPGKRRIPLSIYRAALLSLRRALSATGTPGEVGALSAKGRRDALDMRQKLAKKPAPDIVVVSPDRGSIQTALLSAARPSALIVAHDAARPWNTQCESQQELKLEFGTAVDFGSCDFLEDADATTQKWRESPKTLERRAFALLSFVRHRPEQHVAIVAEANVLRALLAQPGLCTHSTIGASRSFEAGHLRHLKLSFMHELDDDLSDSGSSPEAHCRHRTSMVDDFASGKIGR